jgi:hypothetical protein
MEAVPRSARDGPLVNTVKQANPVSGVHLGEALSDAAADRQLRPEPAGFLGGEFRCGMEACAPALAYPVRDLRRAFPRRKVTMDLDAGRLDHADDAFRDGRMPNEPMLPPT